MCVCVWGGRTLTSLRGVYMRAWLVSAAGETKGPLYTGAAFPPWLPDTPKSHPHSVAFSGPPNR